MWKPAWDITSASWGGERLKRSPLTAGDYVMKTARNEQHTPHHIGAWLSHAARRGVAAVGMGVSLCAVAAGAANAQSVKNIVLVHGAFADGSSWAKLIPILQAKGYHVTA